MRLVYLGTPEMAVPPLRALVEAGHDVVLVVTRDDKRRGRGSGTSPSPVKAAALELGLPVSHSVDDCLAAVTEGGAELGVVVAFGQIIKPHVLAVLPMVNLHFSLLPRWRGAAPVERALLAGDEVTGVCVMALEEGLDTGGVYARREVPIGPETTAAELRTELVDVGTELLVETLGSRRALVGSSVAAGGRGDLRRETRHRRLRDRLGSTRRGDPPVDPGRGSVDDVPWQTTQGRRSAARRRAAAARDRATRREGAHVVRLVAQWRPPRRRRTVRHAVTAPITSPITAPTDRSARRVALDALRRIEEGGAYANLVLGPMLATSGLSDMDRRFVTELVYGTTRMRRACDSLVDRFVTSPP